MTRRRDPGRTRPPLPDTLPESPPDRDAVERALETVLDRLRPKPTGSKPTGSKPTGPGRKPRPDKAAP